MGVGGTDSFDAQRGPTLTSAGAAGLTRHSEGAVGDTGVGEEVEGGEQACRQGEAENRTSITAPLAGSNGQAGRQVWAAPALAPAELHASPAPFPASRQPHTRSKGMQVAQKPPCCPKSQKPAVQAAGHHLFPLCRYPGLPIHVCWTLTQPRLGSGPLSAHALQAQRHRARHRLQLRQAAGLVARDRARLSQSHQLLQGEREAKGSGSFLCYRGREVGQIEPNSPALHGVPLQSATNQLCQAAAATQAPPVPDGAARHPSTATAPATG
jgi:hypothetical protein